MEIYDKNRRPIEVGDVLKIFHFKNGNVNRYMFKL